MSDEPSEEEMHKYGIYMMIIGIIVTGFMYWNNDLRDCQQGVYCTPIEKNWRLAYKLNGADANYKSINGLSAIKNVQAELIFYPDKRVPVPVKVESKDNWDNSIETSSLTYKGIPLSIDSAEAITLNIAFSIPNIPDAVDSVAKLRFFGEVTYPKPKGASSFQNVTSSFDNNFKVTIKPKDFEEPDTYWFGWFWIGIVVFVLGIGARFGPNE